MSRFIFFSAMSVNVLAILFILYFMIAGAHGDEILILTVCLIVPVLSIAAIYSAPDLEERQLKRALNKAQLKKELSKLEK
ncbi:MAG: hypothetical protein GW903_03055 [Alphaproteobacteria bacterium]|nr:hypothetical protein [Alphaproteobacteria bacterium]NCQ87950.1 hypothetical protein [Alphaproteobacteria bacterium]NCT05543.1 hypothetical protein [Alphaproteobacteria bacterium]